MAPRLRQKANIRIELQGEPRLYTTGDSIQGVVTIITPADTPFDHFSIDFFGNTRTYVDRIATATGSPSFAEGSHCFLRITQPDVMRSCPQDHVFRSGKRYCVEFFFVIPDRLLPTACEHTVVSDDIRGAHLLLPPTLGDSKAIPRETLDDMTPNVARIWYSLSASISKKKALESGYKWITVASQELHIRVRPPVLVRPTAQPAVASDEPVTRRAKAIRKVFGGTSGRLIMEAAQPQALHHSLGGVNESSNRSTVAATLRFDPADETTKPPKIGKHTTKLIACNFISCTPRRDFPTRHGPSIHDLSQVLATQKVDLTSRATTSVRWTKHDADANSDESRPNPTGTSEDKPYYTAQLSVELAFPANRVFIPTFHSCLMSRTYLVELKLSLPENARPSSVSLKLPIQVTTRPQFDETLPPAYTEARNEDDHAALDQVSSLSEMSTEGSDEDLGSPTVQNPPDYGDLMASAPPPYNGSRFRSRGQILSHQCKLNGRLAVHVKTQVATRKPLDAGSYGLGHSAGQVLSGELLA